MKNQTLIAIGLGGVLLLLLTRKTSTTAYAPTPSSGGVIGGLFQGISGIVSSFGTSGSSVPLGSSFLATPSEPIVNLQQAAEMGYGYEVG